MHFLDSRFESRANIGPCLIVLCRSFEFFAPLKEQPCIMALWQRKLENLPELTSEDKEEAEMVIPRTFISIEERNYFLRGSDEEASRRVSKLLKGE